MSKSFHIALLRRGRTRAIAVVLALAAALLCTGFDGAQVSEARDGVLDEDYQTELPEFTDAEPENPFDFLDESGEADEESCDPKTDSNCEAEQAGSGADGDGRAGSTTGGGESASGDGASGTGTSGSGDGTGSPSQKSGAAGSEAGSESGSGSFWDHEADIEPPEPPEPPDIDIPDGLLAVLQVLGISILVVIVLLIAWRIYLAVADRTRSAEYEEPEVPEGTGGALRDNAPTRPHAELAGEEYYDEAIHRLLLEVIDLLSEQQRGLSSPSLTSRELLRRVRVDDETHRHLSALVRAVEEILFAKRSADREKYEQSMEHYHQITRALGRGDL